MIQRNEPGLSYTQGWDTENRLTAVSGSGTATFVYDGDGNRVKATLNGTTTVYVGNYYEQTNSVTTTYYYEGGTRVAMRQGTTVNYLLGDHLGSTSITANSSGGFNSELRYKPYGETRYTNGTTPTRHQFTGQITDTEIGLYFYGARYYSSVLGRFLSADTLVPSTSDPQQLNRYSYVRGNPLKYMDPTGHKVEECAFGVIDGHCGSAPSKPKGNTNTNTPGGNGSPESPSSSREEQVQALINARRYDDAIALAIKLYGIRLRMPNRIPRFDPGSSPGSGEGLTDLNANIYIGIDAMSSPGWLASSIGHENIHVEQLNDGAWYLTNEGAKLDEVEAYDWELRNAESNGLTQAERTDDIQRRNSYLYSIQDPLLQLAAEMGNYRTYLFPAWLYILQYASQ